MKKLLKNWLLLFVLMFSLVGCVTPPASSSSSPISSPSSTQVVEKHTVQFYVEDELYKTLKVAENTAIGSDKVAAPVKEGYSFVAWQDENKNVIDLDTYLVTDALKLYATFKEVVTDATLVVDGVKEAGVDYYLVVGWWETTAVDEEGNPKQTSYLTKDTVRLFYANLILYLEAYGATKDQISAVQFRDYSSATVAEMGAAVNADADVDLLIGVGNNINSTAEVSLFEGNDGKTTALMGTKPASRYVALPNHEEMNKLAISIFDWIKTEVGQTAFTKELEKSAITVVPERTNNINLVTTIHGLSGEPVVTTLTSKTDEIKVPAIEVPAGHKFLGYALTSGAEAADITIAAGVALTYAAIEALLNGASTITLYPVIVEEVIDTTYDLVVYVHVVSSSKISEAEFNLFKDRFAATLTEEKNINYVLYTEGKADPFKAKIEEDLAAGETIDVVVGGNNPLSKLVALDTEHGVATCGAGHFADDSRKVVVLNSCASTHVELAKQFYAFMTAEAPVMDLSVAYWHNEHKWVKEEEITAIDAAIKAYVNTYLASEDAFTTYKLTYTPYVCTNTKVADLSAETKALNGGKGVGLIVGSGGNATNDANMGSEIIEHKKVSTTIINAEAGKERYVAICKENSIYRAIYANYFAEAQAAE